MNCWTNVGGYNMVIWRVTGNQRHRQPRRGNWLFTRPELFALIFPSNSTRKKLRFLTEPPEPLVWRFVPLSPFDHHKKALGQ
jgi:hypothetical protein